MIPIDEIRQFVDQVAILMGLNEKEKIVLKFYCATNQAIFKEWSTNNDDLLLTENQIKAVLRPAAVPAARFHSDSLDSTDSRDSDEQMLIYGLTGGFSKDEPDEINGYDSDRCYMET